MFSLLDSLDALSQCRLFAGIASDEMTHLLETLRPTVRRSVRGDMIIRESEPLAGVGVLVSGAAEICKQTPRGDRVLLDTLSPGGLFGEVGAFLSNPVAPASVIAGENCVTLFFSPDSLTENAQGNAARLMRNLLTVLAEKSYLLNRRLGYLMHKSLRARIVAFLYDEWSAAKTATFSIGIGRNKMAEALGVTRPALSRELSRLRDEGYLEYHGESFKIFDLSLWEIH